MNFIYTFTLEASFSFVMSLFLKLINFLQLHNEDEISFILQKL